MKVTKPAGDGRDVRSRLIAFAVREFGAKGFDGASTRVIAAAARTGVSAITYHFGGKRGLHLAAAEHVVALVRERLPLSNEAHGREHDPLAAKAAALRHLGLLFDLLARPDEAGCASFVARELVLPNKAFDTLWAGTIGPFAERLADLVRVAMGASVTQARVTTITLIGQVQVVHVARAALLRLCGPAALSPAGLDLLRARLAANADAILRRACAPDDAPRSGSLASRRSTELLDNLSGECEQHVE